MKSKKKMVMGGVPARLSAAVFLALSSLTGAGVVQAQTTGSGESRCGMLPVQARSGAPGVQAKPAPLVYMLGMHPSRSGPGGELEIYRVCGAGVARPCMLVVGTPGVPILSTHLSAQGPAPLPSRSADVFTPKDESCPPQ